MSVDATTSTGPMLNGRRADSARRRQRVLKALNDAINAGEEITVTYIARRAGVDRSFLYRHGDLLTQIHATEAEPPNATGVGPAVSRASLQTDLLNSQQRAVRLAARVQQLERRLSEALGERAWHESGLGAPTDIDELQQRVVFLEQHTVDLRLQLEERDQDLDAARAANREFMTRINAS
jgi:hypothetical protein